MANQPKKYKKFVATAATATLVASAIVPVASAASLSDIAGNTHEGAITALVDAGIINGYADGTFKPNKELTRSDVVKLLGKYLVTQGYEIPSDATTSPRFSDLTSKSNKELLEYAAVVADAGVFAGSNGKLLAGDPITRENMAIVLVRMVNTLKDVSLEDYVNGQNFTKEVKDLNVAKAEARSAINVLDFYDITTATNFLPKNTVTRGQFATFLNNVIKADFSGASATTGTVKAINATTVEVTFADTVDNINALKFAIEGLTVSNAAVKQTDKKTVVLTTSPQTAGVEYTVTVDGNAVGKFTGLSAVVPTAVKITSNSQQAVVGQQLTLTAEVTVPAGQSKAGIPVTFNVKADSTFNKDSVVEVFTNENGVASYTYTQYAGGEDLVTAYATGKPEVRSTAGKVYWGVQQRLTVTEVTEADKLANNAKKVYKVKATTATGLPQTGRVMVTFAENVDVTPDKGVKDVWLTDATQTGFVNSSNTISSTNVKYGFQYTNGNTNGVWVNLDNKGEATFTLTGEGAAVTPIVFLDGGFDAAGKYTGDGKLSATELQVKADKVTFENVQNVVLKIDSLGTKDAAYYNVPTSTGGRDYKVTVTDVNGKVAGKDTKVYLTIKAEDLGISGSEKVWYLAADGTRTELTGTNSVELKTNAKGEVTFTLVGSKNAYATPTVYFDNGSTVGKLDKTDANATGEIVYFGDAVVNKAVLTVEDKLTGEEVTSLVAGKYAKFVYQVVDQNDKPHYSTSHRATFEVYNNGFNDVTLADGTVIKAQKHASVPFTATASGQAILELTGNGVTDVTVDVHGSQFTLGSKTASVKFTATAGLPVSYTDTLEWAKISNNTFKFDGKDTIVDYTDAKFFIATSILTGTSTTGYTAATISQFEQYISSADDVTILTDADGKYTIYLNIDNAGTNNGPAPAAPTYDGTIALNAASYLNPANPDIKVTITDADLNVTAGANNDTAKFVLKSSNGLNLPITTATAAETSEGVFEYTLSTSEIALLGEGTITVEYSDVNAAGATVVRTATASLTKITGAINSYNLVTPYAPAKPAKVAKYVSSDITSTLTGSITIALNGGAASSAINLAGLSTAQDVADAINAVVSGVASVDGDKVVLTSSVTAPAGSTDATLGSVEVAGSTVSAFPDVKVQGVVATVATAAVFNFTIATNPLVGEKVQIGDEIYTVVAASATAGANEVNVAADADAFAAALVAKINAPGSTSKYTAVNTGAPSAVVTLTQKAGKEAVAPTATEVKVIK